MSKSIPEGPFWFPAEVNQKVSYGIIVFHTWYMYIHKDHWIKYKFFIPLLTEYGEHFCPATFPSTWMSIYMTLYAYEHIVLMKIIFSQSLIHFIVKLSHETSPVYTWNISHTNYRSTTTTEVCNKLYLFLKRH